ncbi:MAG: hypothetical protein FWE47_01610 [Oscillospiraceae bacterium]|nr:hypothetical protein [Oscillospiraceae bacterium]
MNKKRQTAKLIWRITYAHTIAYFIAGALMMYFLSYEEIWAMDIMSFYRPIDDPLMILAGTVLQIPRGILIALFILPLRKAFFEEKYGLWKLGLIVIGFALISTIGAPWASYESYIYTKFPLWLQLKGYPESILYVGLFIGILYISQKFEHKKAITILSIVIMSLLSIMSIMGYMQAI